MGYGGKILAAMGAGGYDTVPANPDYRGFGPKNPFLIFIGPSGNVCRAPYPGATIIDYGGSAGASQQVYPDSWQGWQNIGVNCLSWGGNELIFTQVHRYGTGYFGNIYYTAFCPYGGLDRLETAFAGDALTNDPAIVGNRSLGPTYPGNWGNPYPCWVQDGYYKKIGRSDFGNYTRCGSTITICDMGHFVDYIPYSFSQLQTFTAYTRGFLYGVQHTKFWTADELAPYGQSAVYTSGYLSLFHGFTHASQQGGTSNEYTGGTAHQFALDATSSLDTARYSIQHQTVYKHGRIYIVAETLIGVTTPATICGYGFVPLLKEGSVDIEVRAGEYVNHQPSIAGNWTTGAAYKAPIDYNQRLLLLTNYGKLYEIVDGEVVLINDVVANTSLTSQASGIYGGRFTDDPDSVNGYKCYGVELNDTLHLFLNYRRADGNAGIAWLKSSDLSSFVDNSASLPNSGIVPPSGMTTNEYLGKIGTYKFSGYNNFDTVLNGQPSGTTGPAVPCQPSGWLQASGIEPIWQGSGTFYDCDYDLSPDQWDVPMYYDVQTKFLYPTQTKEPIAFIPSGLQPSGTKFEGWRWNGVHNYHVFGYKDQIEEKVHLFFSEDVLYNDEGDASLLSQDPPSQVLYYTLDSNENWEFKNQFRCKRISWLEPTDMHEPSILLPSGSVVKRFPYEDRLNRVVYQPVRIYDWPFFDSVDLEVQYTTDYGLTWSNATPHTTLSDSMSNIDTGSLSTDPSGIIGVEKMFAWDYTSDVGGGRVDHVQFRFRAIG